MYDYEYEIKSILTTKGIKYIDCGKSLKVKCFNPSHNDKNPSCYIDLNKGLWHCFSCGASGNFITMQKILLGKVERRDDIFTFNEPLRKNEEIKYPNIKIIGKLKNPKENSEIMKFLNSIGVYKEEFIDKYNIQYTTYSEMISEELYNDENSNPTKMMNRICVPIYHENKLINMECRTFKGEKPKVKYVKGGSTNTLFNWENIDKNKRVVVVGADKNFFKMWNVYPNSVAMFHCIPTEQQMKMLNECKEICLFADNDKAGLEDSPNKINKGYKGKFYITHDSRTYEIYEDGEYKTKGYDCNDCSLNEIENHLSKAKLYAKKEFIW